MRTGLYWLKIANFVYLTYIISQQRLNWSFLKKTEMVRLLVSERVSMVDELRDRIIAINISYHALHSVPVRSRDRHTGVDYLTGRTAF